MSRPNSHIDRRSMMFGSGLMIAGFAAQRGVAAGQYSVSESNGVEDKDLQFLTSDPRNGEPALDKLVQSWITPTKLFYVRSHAPNPDIDVNEFRLEVAGMVDEELSLSMDDLRSYPEQEVTATLTCAGNRRVEFNKVNEVGGVQWGPGAIGNATWTGIRLADVLKRAGIKPEGKHVWFEGLDEIEKGDGVIGFGASIPIEKVMEQQKDGAASTLSALLCYGMNGETLTADHGYPLRALVPGYIGARSVKWLGKITVSDRPSPNHYVQTAYKIVPSTDDLAWREAGPIYRFPINAAFPFDNEVELEPGPLKLTGYVLPTGLVGTRVRRVQVSADSGTTWTTAEFVGDESEHCWRLWQADVEVTRDTAVLIARANDSAGRFMPSRVPWNAKGYLQNSWYRVPVKVG